MAKIGLDLDGVTYKFVDALRLYVHKVKGIPMEKMPPALSWSFYEDWGFTLEEYLNITAEGVKAGDIFWKGEAYDGCKEVINYLYHERGDEIIFITSRNAQDAALARIATVHWLNNEIDLPYDELIMSDDKFDHKVDVFFDDAPYHFEKDIDISCGVIFDQPWNWHVTHVPRVLGWLGIRAYIDQKFPVFRNPNVIEKPVDKHWLMD